jgi:NAD(P)-dependent dehydrogenase (short-subunit alcohol dehydrogenase family)
MATAESLRARRIVLTGATAGVGRATALRLADAGARITLLVRDPAALDALAEEVVARGGETLPVSCDVADEHAVFAAAERAVEVFGGIDVWINNAMTTVFSPVRQLRPDEFRRITEVCYFGCVFGTMAALQQMRRQGDGMILQVGSALAYRGIPLQAAYCGAKHAARGFTDSLRTELLHEESRIALTAVHPPGMDTPQFDWGRTRFRHRPRPAGMVLAPEAAAEAVIRAIEWPAREYWVGAQTAVTIIGNMLAPSAADRYLAHKAIEGQQGDTEIAADRPDNLFTPVTGAGLHRTRGSFSEEARPKALRLRAAPLPLTVALIVMLIMTGIGFVLGAALG